MKSDQSLEQSNEQLRLNNKALKKTVDRMSANFSRQHQTLVELASQKAMAEDDMKYYRKWSVRHLNIALWVSLYALIITAAYLLK